MSLGFVAASDATPDEPELPYPEMAAHIARALRPSAGERALVRYAEDAMPELARSLEAGLRSAGVEVELLPYGPVEEFETRLAAAGIYVWLPEGRERQRPADQTAALVRWLDAGRGRQVHFHWGDGTRALDGLSGEHSPAYDRVYLEALDVDYAEIDRWQRTAASLLASEPVRVTTPAGTDLHFLVGSRPVTLQNGDASKARTDAEPTRIGREIELPCGAIRVAPIEESVEGTLVVPSARFDGVTAKNLRLQIRAGQVVKMEAETGLEAAQAALRAAPDLRRFRELAIGFNPLLTTPAGEPWVAYYGYGAGVVRLSLGDNAELGGKVRGRGVSRWFFFVDATVSAGRYKLVQDGDLVAMTSYVVRP